MVQELKAVVEAVEIEEAVLVGVEEAELAEVEEGEGG